MTIVENDLSAQSARAFHFHRWRICRHHDRGWHVQQLRRACDPLRVITGGKGDHAGFALVCGHPRQTVIGSTQLEGPAQLKRFAFYP